MKVALIICSNLYVAPYVRYYTKILEESGIAYDIIGWNRSGIEEAGVQAFQLKSGESNNVISKYLDFLRYRKFVKSNLAEKHYDKIVVFTIMNMLMLFPFLKAKYRNNYVFDIRDYSIALRCFRSRFTSAVTNAAMVVTSSAGFKQWLPRGVSYFIRHNTSEFKPFNMLASIKGQTKWKILTIGALRNPNANKKLIQELADCPMFEVSFVGSGPAEPTLRKYAARQGIQNINLHGRYAKQDEPKYLEGASLINIMMDGSINSRTLMSNRFYLSLIYGIPVIVDDNTEQTKWVKKYNLGVIIDKKSGIKEQLIQYLRIFSPETFDAGRKACLQIVQQDIEGFEAGFEAFLSR